MWKALILLVAAATPVSIPGSWSARERAAAEHVGKPPIAAHVKYLADDLLEGRAPASRGSELAMKYIASQYERLGLEPGGDDGTWYQKFDIVGVKGDVTRAP